MRRALRQVREEMGADAIILSHRRHPQGVELEVAVDSPAAGAVQDVDPLDWPVGQVKAASTGPVAVQGPSEDAGGAQWQLMQQELQGMRDLLEQRLSAESWTRLRRERPGQAAMWRRLQRMGLSPRICRLLLADYAEAETPQRAWQQLMQQLARLLPVDTSDPVSRGGVHILVGPAGAGKTSTVAKLAARHVLEHGPEGVALVTTDRFRLGAQEQLRTLSRILQVPLLAASERESLGALVYRLRHHRLVLVDTPGLRRQDARQVEQLQAIDALGERACVWQVLAATSQAQVLQAEQRTFRTGNLRGAILTKLDEAASLGEPVSLLVSTGVPLTYTANGQNIPGDLAVANARDLIAAAIAAARDAHCDEETLARDYAEVAAAPRMTA